jgi:probable HAF family extracellular repeat protein
MPAHLHHLKATPGQVPINDDFDVYFINEVSKMKKSVLVMCVIVGFGSVAMGYEQTHAFIWDASAGIRDLGHAEYGVARDINNAGTVAGSTAGYANAGSEWLGTACLWDTSLNKTFLGALEGYSFHSDSYAINSNLQVVGDSSGEALGQRGFIWDSVSGMQELPPLPGWESSSARGINDSGQVVGLSYIDAHSWSMRPTVWNPVEGSDSYALIDLDPNGDDDDGAAIDINNAGQVVGWFDNSNIGFLWDATNGLQYLPFYPAAINNHGQIAGWRGGGDGACFWDPIEGLQQIELLPGDQDGRGHDINDSGEVVGFSRPNGGKAHAFIWDAVNGTREIPSLGGNGTMANAINNSGQVVGSSHVPDPAAHAAASGPYILVVGEDLQLDGSSSYGASDIVSWLWNLDFDRLYDDGVGESTIIPFEYWSGVLGWQVGGQYTIGLEIQTLDGVVDQDSALVVVVPEPATVTLLTLGGLAILRRRRNR